MITLEIRRRAAMAALLASSLTGSFGCDELLSPKGEEAEAEEATSGLPDTLLTPMPSAQKPPACPAERALPASEPMFEMLGLADEVAVDRGSDADLGEPLLESFFEGEAELADRYGELIERHAAQTKQTIRPRREIDDDDKIAFYSKKLADEMRPFFLPSGTVDPCVVLKAAAAQQRAYIRGAHSRFAEPGTAVIEISEGLAKTRTIAKTLRALGAHDVAVFSVNTIPTSALVLFEPNENLTRELGIVEPVSVRDLLQQKVSWHITVENLKRIE